DPGEDWEWDCRGSFTADAVIPVVFSGKAGDAEVSDVATIRIDIGKATPHPNIHLHVQSNPARLPYGGGTAYLTYHVTNDGSLPLAHVSLASNSDTCSTPGFTGGDDNEDGILDLTETWTYTCIERLTATEADAPQVRGTYDDHSVSDDALFIIPVATQAPSPVDPTVDGTYVAAVATAGTPDIDTNGAYRTEADVHGCVPGVPYKLADDHDAATQADTAVYYCGRDGMGHVFPNHKIFRSWYPDFTNVLVVDRSTLQGLPLGQPVLYRPGARMIKTVSDPKVYAVARGGILRWITSEAAAEALYGADWRTMVDDVAASVLQSYVIGAPISR
ncbi:MAG: hypothetical protein RLZZ324_1091, partial [Candidatus Parcubacteria bacterium]